MNKALEALAARGFISQCTDLEGLSAAMDAGPVTFYVGCDPTGGSLHIGHMVPFFAFRHLVAAGHRGIALVGGGTARIGDPSGKTEMRKMLSYDELDANTAKIKGQLNAFLGGFDGKKIIFDNNKNWLADLNYIDFLREIGSHFSVNKMLSFEAYKMRMKTGLSFIEFNYQLLQSYDYLQLQKRHGCALQIGGDDQWGNICAGIDLIRRIEGDKINVFGLTFPLVTTSDGKKMGKTEKGALFLDENMVSSYDFYQYWRNVSDADTEKFLKLFSFRSIEEISALCSDKNDPNAAKMALAFDITATIHGKEAADAAENAARAVFATGNVDIAQFPPTPLPRGRFAAGYPVCDLFVDAALCATKSDARRLIEQGGAALVRGENTEKITDVKMRFGADKLDNEGNLLLRAGKKKYCRVVAE